MNFRLLSDTPIAPAGRRAEKGFSLFWLVGLRNKLSSSAPLLRGSAVLVLLIGLSFINIIIPN